MWLMAAAIGTAWADGQCPCVEWAGTWAWSPCDPSVEACGCACTDVLLLTGTTFTASSLPVVECSPEGLTEPARAGAQCVLASAECVSDDCGYAPTPEPADPDTGDEGEPGSACASVAVAPPGGAALGLLIAALRRRRTR